jgi:uncharacterized protein YeaO (DUF488 family)
MKKSELQSLINECIGEVLNEGKVAKKKEAIKEIKRIITENEIDEIELDEIFGFGSKPATDEELDKWLKGNPAMSSGLKKMEAEKAKSWREFVKKEFAKNIKNDEAILNVTFENGEWKKTQGRSGGRSTGFSQ